MERVTSRQNPVVKQFRAATESPSGGVLLDGPHLLREALASAVPVELVAVREDEGNAEIRALARDAEDRGARVVAVTDAVLSAMSPVRNPAGVVAIARRPARPLDAALDDAPQLVLVLCDVQDPGNVGAIVRAADGCGATGVITTGATADPFGWKALRGSMGSAFRIPVVPRQLLEDAVRAARARGIRVLAAVPRGGVPLPQCDLRGPSAVLLGAEGPGLPDAALALADERLSIPMRRPIDSLNVAAAAAVIGYEAMRQREAPPPRP